MFAHVSFEPVDTHGRLAHLTWEGLIHLGAGQGDFGGGLVGKREAALGRDDLATISSILRAGPPAARRGVMLTHGNLLSNAEETYQNDPLKPEDVLRGRSPSVTFTPGRSTTT